MATSAPRRRVPPAKITIRFDAHASTRLDLVPQPQQKNKKDQEPPPQRKTAWRKLRFETAAEPRIPSAAYFVGSSVSQLGKHDRFRPHRTTSPRHVVTHTHTYIDAVGSCGGSLHCTRRGREKKRIGGRKEGTTKLRARGVRCRWQRHPQSKSRCALAQALRPRQSWAPGAAAGGIRAGPRVEAHARA